MKLYHFTCPWTFWGDDWKSLVDLEAGMMNVPLRDLLPSNKQYDWEGCPPPWQAPVVWLTADGHGIKPSLDEPNVLRIRLTVRLPSADSRLKTFVKWHKGYASAMPEEFYKRATADWWTYRGTIPASAVVDVQFFRGSVGWWEVAA